MAFTHFPSEEVTGPPQCTRVRVAKNNEVFWLEYNNEVIFIASDRHLSPWLNKTINRIKGCRQFNPPRTQREIRSMLTHARRLLCTPLSPGFPLSSHDGRHDVAS